MTEPGTCPSEVVRCEPVDTRLAGIPADYMPHCLLRQTVAPGFPVLVYPSKQLAGSQVGSLEPFVEHCLDPVRHRYGSGMPSFAFQVDDGPVVFSLLDVAEIQIHGLVPSKSAGEQHRQERAVPFALQRLRAWRVPVVAWPTRARSGRA